MAREHADDDPQASEYAGKDSPDDSDNDEGLYVETNANVTKLLTTQALGDPRFGYDETYVTHDACAI